MHLLDQHAHGLAPLDIEGEQLTLEVDAPEEDHQRRPIHRHGDVRQPVALQHRWHAVGLLRAQERRGVATQLCAHDSWEHSVGTRHHRVEVGRLTQRPQGGTRQQRRTRASQNRGARTGRAAQQHMASQRPA